MSRETRWDLTFDGVRATRGTCSTTFDLDEWGYVPPTHAGNVAPEHEDGVRRALLDCPVHAVTEPHPAAEAGATR